MAPLLAFAVVTLFALALAPALLAAAISAALLQRHHLGWTWALPPQLVVAAAVAVLAPHEFHHLAATAAATAAGRTGPAALASVLWPLWLLTAPAATALIKRWLDHRARLRGGHTERAAHDQLGPLDVWRRHHARRAAAADGPHNAAGVLVGSDDRGRPVRLPTLRAHAAIVGGSDTGKTNTAEVLIEGHVAAGAGFVVLDGKGGQALPRAALQLAAEYQRPVALWSIVDYGDPELDARRMPWNVTGDGNPTEIKDRIASSENQSEPYYAAVAARGLLAASRALIKTVGHVRLDDLAACLDDPDTLKSRLKAADPDGFAIELAWLEKLGEPERSGLRGMGLRLRTMVASDGGESLLPAADGTDINLHRAIRDGWLVVFTLPQGTYPELIPHVTRYVLQAINGVCSRIESSGTMANAVVFVDELSAFDGDQLCAGYERGRSAGVRFIVATQSLSNFESAGGPKLIDAVLDNSELIVIHRQAVPDSAEKLASVGGTEEAWEHTHKVSSGGLGTSAGVDLGLDESGERARRLTDRFRAHPNRIKQLRQGEAVVISSRPRFQVRQLVIRPGLTALATLPST